MPAAGFAALGAGGANQFAATRTCFFGVLGSLKSLKAAWEAALVRLPLLPGVGGPIIATSTSHTSSSLELLGEPDIVLLVCPEKLILLGVL